MVIPDVYTITVIQEQVWEADVGILLTRVDYLVWNVTERCCWDTKAFIGQCRWMREVGGVTGKRDVGYKAAKCKEGHGYIFVYFDKWSNFWWSPVRLDHSAYDIYNDQQDPSLLILKIGILYILIRLYRLDDDWPDIQVENDREFFFHVTPVII